jgi:hypothetical protein
MSKKDALSTGSDNVVFDSGGSIHSCTSSCLKGEAICRASQDVAHSYGVGALPLKVVYRKAARLERETQGRRLPSPRELGKERTALEAIA